MQRVRPARRRPCAPADCRRTRAWRAPCTCRLERRSAWSIRSRALQTRRRRRCWPRPFSAGPSPSARYPLGPTRRKRWDQWHPPPPARRGHPPRLRASPPSLAPLAPLALVPALGPAPPAAFPPVPAAPPAVTGPLSVGPHAENNSEARHRLERTWRISSARSQTLPFSAFMWR